jgi:hypothetical protein
MTSEDLAQIRTVVREENAAAEARMREQIAATEARILDHVLAEISTRAEEITHRLEAHSKSLKLISAALEAIDMRTSV